jgi:DNA mismatch repair ATPase MutL
LASAVAEGRVPRQTLLFPDRAELAPAQEDALGRHGSALQSLGFEWSLLGESTYAVRALPTVVADARAAAMFEAAIEAALRNSDDPLHAAVSALGHAGATPNGEPLTGDQARRVAGSIDLSSEEHRACIVARVPLPFLPPSSNDE